MIKGVNVTAPGVGHGPLDSGSKVARSSTPFLPMTRLRPLFAPAVEAFAPYAEKLDAASEAITSAFAPYAAFVEQTEEIAAGLAEQQHRHHEALRALYAQLPVMKLRGLCQ